MSRVDKGELQLQDLPIENPETEGGRTAKKYSGYTDSFQFDPDPPMLCAEGTMPRYQAERQSAMLSILRRSSQMAQVKEHVAVKAQQPYRDILAGMWGTSGKDFDLVWTRIYGNGLEAGIEPMAFQSFPVPKLIGKKLQEYRANPWASIPDIAVLDRLIAHTVARAINVFVMNCAQAMEAHSGKQLVNQDFDCFAFAGVTLWHAPQSSPYSSEELGSDFLARTGGGLDARFSWSLGDGDIIAQETGIDVISDLRVRNVAAGGQGAPYAPFYDVVILRHPRRKRCIQNIGGIGNVTFVFDKGTFENTIAFDTGPGNMLIDEFARRMTGDPSAFDYNGKIALSAKPDPDIVEGALSREYFHLPPPKSTGFEELGFGPKFADWLVETWPGRSWPVYIASATEITGESIGRAYRDFLPHPPDEVITCGGGENNPAVFNAISRAVRKYCGEQVIVRRYGKYSQWKEAMIMALVANDSMSNLDINLARATGAPPTVCGKWSFAGRA